VEGRIGKYTIVEELGRGAMGIVYKAVDPLIDRTVAIKTIRFDMYSQPEQRVEAQKRFLREAKSAGNITHPNIVTIYDMGEDDGTFYIAMEYVDGPSLETILAARKKWTVEETIRLIVEIADGLDSTHKKGIIHRDIKPGNILIDKEGRPHIVDFGIARVPTSNLTQTSAVMGTPYYMAPEQVAARKIDHRVDIFALGAIFYEMLTLEKPFSGENLTTVIYKIMNEPPHPLREFQSDVPQGLEPIIQKVLAKDPDIRYQTCRDLIDDLLKYAEKNGMVIGDRFRARSPLSETQKMSKPAAAKAVKAQTRRPLPIIIGAMALVVVIALAAILLIRKDGPDVSKGAEEKPDPTVALKPDKQVPDNKTDVKTENPNKIVPDTKTGTPNKTVPETKAENQNRPDKPADKTIPVVDKTKTTPNVSDKPKPPVDQPKAKDNAQPPAETGDIEAAEAALKAGDLRGAADAAQRALRANPGLERAKAVMTAVLAKTAPGEITAVVNEYLANLKANKLLAFYQSRCTPALYEKLRKNVDMMAKLFQNMEGVVSNMAFDTGSAKYPNFAVKARFNHTITAIPKGKRLKETIFDGSYIWSVEKVNQRWILNDLVFEAR
jgi:eukaryotic-like serine/threonine-protein kinase